MTETFTKDGQVVAAYDVYFTRPPGQVFIEQFALRPPWRPYSPNSDFKSIHYKPKAKRLQMEVDLEGGQGSCNYNPEALDASKLRALKLEGLRVDMRADFALATIKGNKLFLAPVDETWALRPSLEHLDAARPLSRAAEPPKEEEKPALTALSVHVQRRETERQHEQRINSYAFLAAREREEAWIPIQGRTPDSAEGGVAWALLREEPPGGPAMDLPRAAYNAVVVAGEGGAMAQPPGDAGAGAAAAAAGPASTAAAAAAGAGGARDGAAGAAASALGADAHAALKRELHELLSQHSVASMDDLREHLQRKRAASPAGSGGAGLVAANDATLHQAVLATGLVRSIRKVYILRATGNTSADRLRGVVLDLLKGKDSLKKADVASAAAAEDVPFSDAVYSRVIKELCDSRGSSWFLKTGV